MEITIYALTSIALVGMILLFSVGYFIINGYKDVLNIIRSPNNDIEERLTAIENVLNSLLENPEDEDELKDITSIISLYEHFKSEINEPKEPNVSTMRYEEKDPDAKFENPYRYVKEEPEELHTSKEEPVKPTKGNVKVNPKREEEQLEMLLEPAEEVASKEVEAELKAQEPKRVRVEPLSDKPTKDEGKKFDENNREIIDASTILSRVKRS